MGENLLIVDDYREVPKIIAETIADNATVAAAAPVQEEQAAPNLDNAADTISETDEPAVTIGTDDSEEML